MTTVHVPVGTGYDVAIEAGLLTRAATHLAGLARNGRLIVVYDANVVQHLALLSGALAPVHIDAIVVPPGEPSKDWAGLIALTDRLIALGIERTETIVALGGGVVGDLAGFAASIVKRGCGVVQIPTTLLAQVDSSVGGKTAINTTAGKNLIGAFHQPSLVLIDPTVLGTLAPRELRAGYAEVVKYGLIDNPAFFAWCEGNGAALLAGDVNARQHAITASVAAKARIVASDVHETTGTRALLNLGHTFAHALEAETGFGDQLIHGEAVAAGMALAFRFSVSRGQCPPDDSARVTAHLASVGLPTRVAQIVDTDGPTLAAHMAHDKKRIDGAVPLLLARGIGQTFVATGIDLGDVAAFLDAETD